MEIGHRTFRFGLQVNSCFMYSVPHGLVRTGGLDIEQFACPVVFDNRGVFDALDQFPTDRCVHLGKER
ncbi:MAG: hypothetical protein HKP10_07450 [Kiritimatiellales bacterium]|nr:hypothetical protein [Kiritimatiellales bacterium]